MTRYEEQFYYDFKQLVNTMKEILQELKEIKVEMTPHSQVRVDQEAKFSSTPHCFTYGEICMMKEEYEKARDMFNTQRTGEERNDK